jgi:hypothetical protein
MTENVSENEPLVKSDVDLLRKVIRDIEDAERSQPLRLAEVRAQVEAERQKALASEPWAELMAGLLTVDRNDEPTGVLQMPTVEGKELFGTRLAFDLLGRCANEEEVSQKLNEYFSMVKKPDHLLLVAYAALDTIANYVVPALLDIVEHRASDYDSRVWLADAARNAWKARVRDLEEGATPA